MAKRRLMIEVDCGKRRCKQCEYMDGAVYASCDAFDETGLDLDDKRRPLRLDVCKRAELPEVPSADQLSRWRAVADYVNGGGIAHYEREMARALLEAADFVDAVRLASTCGEVA